MHHVPKNVQIFNVHFESNYRFVCVFFFFIFGCNFNVMANQIQNDYIFHCEHLKERKKNLFTFVMATYTIQCETLTIVTNNILHATFSNKVKFSPKC